MTGAKRSHPIRVLLAKPGLDGHDRGVKVILRALRDAGMEVIYSGIRATPLGIARAAIEEDVDAVGVSNLSGAHPTLFPAIADSLRDTGVNLDVVVLFGGGMIPAEDQPPLLDAGYRKLFTPGASTSEIIEFLESHVPATEHVDD